jgi:hypothetical protein
MNEIVSKKYKATLKKVGEIEGVDEIKEVEEEVDEIGSKKYKVTLKKVVEIEGVDEIKKVDEIEGIGEIKGIDEIKEVIEIKGVKEKSKICTICKCEKLLDEFNKFSLSKDGKYPSCKKCNNIKKDHYYKTLNGCLNNLIGSAKSHAKKILDKGQIEAGIFELIIDDLQTLWENQEGKCYYSGIKMNYDKNEWKISLERLNEDLGYIKNNVVLCCLEFNGTSQWTQQKIINMLKLLKQEFKFEKQDFELINKKTTHKKFEYSIKTVINNIDHYKCTFCHENKTRDQFNKNINNGCKKCRSLYAKQRNDTPRIVLLLLLRNSKSHTKTREITNIGKRDNTHDIDFNFLVELYNKQKGVCAYSGLPLKFIANQYWKISLERIDVFKGYTKDNICLICKEFNTGDYSIRYKNNDSGNSGWTKEKFDIFVKYATEKYKNSL